jgi:hypothetical protein
MDLFRIDFLEMLIAISFVFINFFLKTDFELEKLQLKINSAASAGGQEVHEMLTSLGHGWW